MTPQRRAPPRAAPAPQGTSDREIVVTRLLDAPRELVFRVWTQPEHAGQWWGPHGFTTTTHAMDVRPGGEWRYTMHGPDGTDYPNRIRYEEVVPPERLVYQHSGADDPDARFHTTVTFQAQGGLTLLTMRALFNSPEALRAVIEKYHADEGARQHLENLSTYLASLSGTSHTEERP